MDLQHGKTDSEQKLKEVMEQYFNACFEGLHRYAYTLLRDNDDAKDAVQAVFLRLWEKRNELDDGRSVKSYLYTAVYNHCLNIKRHEKVKERYKADAGHQAYEPGNVMLSKEAGNRIMAQIEQLPPQCRLIFSMSRFDGKKYAEIAAELGLSVKTVEAQMGKALRILREKLAELLVTVIILILL